MEGILQRQEKEGGRTRGERKEGKWKEGNVPVEGNGLNIHPVHCCQEWPIASVKIKIIINRALDGQKKYKEGINKLIDKYICNNKNWYYVISRFKG